jgi:hypothetical protein
VVSIVVYSGRTVVWRVLSPVVRVGVIVQVRVRVRVRVRARIRVR